MSAYLVDTGIEFGRAEFDGRAVAGFDAVGDGQGGADCTSHGTHVAGTIGGATYGVARDAASSSRAPPWPPPASPAPPPSTSRPTPNHPRRPPTWFSDNATLDTPTSVSRSSPNRFLGIAGSCPPLSRAPRPGGGAGGRGGPPRPPGVEPAPGA
ncbi:hypothetical protein ACFVZ3_36400, partial [Kitasatospora purpeofusca]